MSFKSMTQKQAECIPEDFSIVMFTNSSLEKHVFNLQVFCILMVQLMVTFSVVSLFTFW